MPTGINGLKLCECVGPGKYCIAWNFEKRDHHNGVFQNIQWLFYSNQWSSLSSHHWLSDKNCHLYRINFVTLMLIPLEEFMTPLEDSYFLHIFFAFLYILCTFKIIFLLIITITTSCNKTLDILEYFTMILICRIVQKKTLLNRQFLEFNKKKFAIVSSWNKQ